MKKHMRRIILIVCCFGIGAVAAVMVNKIAMKQYTNQVIDYTQAGTVNWFLAVPVFIALLTLIPAGFIMGRIIER